MREDALSSGASMAIEPRYALRPPQFVIRNTYRPDALAKRDAVFADHVSYLRGSRRQIRFSGPTLSDEGGAAPTGGYTIIDLPDRAAAEAFIDAEPFNMAGMLDEIEITRFVSLGEERQADSTPASDKQMFLCECIDDPDGSERRQRMAVAAQELQDDAVVTQGLMLSDDGSRIMGSVFIVEVADRRAAEAFVENHPLTTAGVFGVIRIDRWRFGMAIG